MWITRLNKQSRWKHAFFCRCIIKWAWEELGCRFLERVRKYHFHFVLSLYANLHALTPHRHYVVSVLSSLSTRVQKCWTSSWNETFSPWTSLWLEKVQLQRDAPVFPESSAVGRLPARELLLLSSLQPSARYHILNVSFTESPMNVHIQNIL